VILFDDIVQVPVRPNGPIAPARVLSSQQPQRAAAWHVTISFAGRAAASSREPYERRPGRLLFRGRGV